MTIAVSVRHFKIQGSRSRPFRPHRSILAVSSRSQLHGTQFQGEWDWVEPAFWRVPGRTSTRNSEIILRCTDTAGSVHKRENNTIRGFRPRPVAPDETVDRNPDVWRPLSTQTPRCFQTLDRIPIGCVPRRRLHVDDCRIANGGQAFPTCSMRNNGPPHAGARQTGPKGIRIVLRSPRMFARSAGASKQS